MLAHSPPFPIIIDHFHKDRHVHDDRMTEDDVEGIVLALAHRDRVRRIRFRTPLPTPEKIIAPIDGAFPMLEYLCIAPMHNMNILLPKTFQAPQLRHLILVNLIRPIEFPLLSAATGLVALSLVNILPSTHLQPYELLHRVSLMPQLEILWIRFDPSSSGDHVDLDLTHMDNATRITLPHLRFFEFCGFNTYSEVLLSRITAPHLESVSITFWEEWTYSVPYLLQFMSTSDDLRLGGAVLSFNSGGARLSVYPNETARVSVFDLFIAGGPGRKVSNAAQILTALRPLFSSVVYLTLNYKDYRFLPELQDEAEPTDWRVLLRSFNNVKILFVAKGVVEKLSRSLQFDDGDPPNALLPELRRIIFSPPNDNVDSFTGFIDARQHAGHPVILAHHQDAESNPS